MGKKSCEIIEYGHAEVVIKKSRFIGEAHNIKNVDDATNILSSIKKEHYDAKHHCFGYVLGDENSIRFSDDGEPSGTAGKPILDTLLNDGMLNAIIVVTRYFGGTLLGTGGLTRAYRQAATKALEAAIKIDRQIGIEIKATLSYDFLGKAENLLKESDGFLIGSEYKENVTLDFVGDEAGINSAIKKLNDITGGTVLIDISEEKAYGINENRVIWL